MLKIDLHTHSNHSDGTETPAQVMRQAQKAGLDVIALTDHDVTSGWEEAAAVVKETQVGLVRGMEISCAWQGITVHLLSYLHNPENPDLTQAHARTLSSRQGRAREMVESLSEDYPLTWEDVLAQAPQPNGSLTADTSLAVSGPIGRPHIADALVEKGCFPDRSACFDTVLHPRSRYYVKHWSLDPVEAVELVRAAGGVPVMAHPRARMRQKLLPTRAIIEMTKHGLAGLEVFHRDNSVADREFLIELACAYQLLITGSSDYHGTGKPNQLGEHLTKSSVLEKIAQQGELEVLLP